MPENRYDPLALDRSKFPPNKGEHERPQKVAQATILKPSTKQRLLSAIFAGDFSTTRDKLIYDVAVPMLRDFIAGGLKNAIDMAFYGKAGNGRGYTDYTRPSAAKVSYSSRASAMQTETPRDREIERNLSFQSREDAYAIIDKMQELIDLYGQVSVADLCDLTGVDSEFTDNRYGWKDLRNAVVVKRGQKWVLDLPRTRVID